MLCIDTDMNKERTPPPGRASCGKIVTSSAGRLKQVATEKGTGKWRKGDRKMGEGDRKMEGREKGNVSKK